MSVPTLEPLTNHFAVQRRGPETSHEIAEIILRAAKTDGVLFRHLEAFGLVSIGSMNFVRFRSEGAEVARTVLTGIGHSQNRAVIGPSAPGEYLVWVPGGRSAKVSNLLMHQVARPGETKLYMGTRIKRWEEQFRSIETPQV
jgi:hypothetical protein